MKSLDEEFDKKIEEEALFLLRASEDYLKALKLAAEKLRLDAFLQALQQLHKSIGEILGLSKYMQAKKERFEKVFLEIMAKTQKILQEVFHVTEEFRERFLELCKKANSGE